MSQTPADVLEQVGARASHAPQLLLCLDFDGTLVPIADSPEGAHIEPDTRRLLADLAGRPDITIAIISGRNRSELQTIVDIPGLIYAGNHGLEISGPGFVFVEPTAAACRDALQALSVELRARLAGIPGTVVEDKGLTIGVHDRQVSDEKLEEVRRLVHAVLANSAHPFHMIAGERIYDIRPRVVWDKSTAVNWIRNQTAGPDALVIFIGDDDEEAFAALQDDVTIKVGSSGETTARYRLENIAEVRMLLRRVARSNNRREACSGQVSL
jgi:trehalose 6-phosphate phosphatase